MVVLGLKAPLSFSGREVVGIPHLAKGPAFRAAHALFFRPDGSPEVAPKPPVADRTKDSTHHGKETGQEDMEHT